MSVIWVLLVIDMGLIEDLKQVGTFLVTELTTELVRKDKKASGNLLKSFRSEVNGVSGGYEIAVIAASYFKFVDQGVNGTKSRVGSQYSYRSKKPPLEPLLQWVQIRSIASGNKAVRSAAFAIQTHIWKNGVKGINIVEQILKKTSEQYLDKIADSMLTQVSLKIDTIIKNGNLNK